MDFSKASEQRGYPGLLSPVQDYNPFQAGLLAAGAATSNTLEQLRRAYYTGQGLFADRWNLPDLRRDATAALEEIARRQSEATALYEPLQQAFPYSTAMGEAIPAIFGGVRQFPPAASLNALQRFMDNRRATPIQNKQKAIEQQ